MVNKQMVLLALAICNSIYLSYISLEAFMLNDNLKQFTQNFVLSLSTLFFIIIGYVLVLFVKKSALTSFWNKRKTHPKSTDNKFLVAWFLITAIMMIFILGKITILNLNLDNLILFFSLIFEIMSLFLFSRVDQGIYKFINNIVLWFITGVCTYLVYGFFVKYLEYDFLKNIDLKVVFTSIFFHLLNACALFYSYFENNILQSQIKE